MLRAWPYTVKGEGCIGKYIPLGPWGRGFCTPRPSRSISWSEGCKISVPGKSLGPGGMNFLVHPSSWQCTDTLHLLPVSSALHFTGYLHITNFVLNWSNLAQCTEEMGALLWLLEDSALWASPCITEYTNIHCNTLLLCNIQRSHLDSILQFQV